MPAYPLPTLGPTISAAGITIPSYNDVLQSLVASMQQIYGSDIVVSPDSQDGQWLAVIAQAITDQNNAAVALYNSFSPVYAQGSQLSSLVKLNGLSRNVPTNSTAVGTVTGSVGISIVNGVVKDVNGNLWNLPAAVTIPISGSIVVTVTAQQPGSTPAQIGDISQIFNPQYGWTSFTNTSSATVGAPVESDATLRRRQAASTSLPALGILASIFAAIGNVPGVTRWQVYENATGAPDSNGVPAHSFCSVVEGGTTTAIAAAIVSRKPPGIQTFGTTTVNGKDAVNLPYAINYSVLAYTQVFVNYVIQSLSGYTAAVGTDSLNAIVAFINSLTIGESLYYTQLLAAAQLVTLAEGQTFYIASLVIGTKSFTAKVDNGSGGAGTILNVSAMAPGSAPIQVGDTIYSAGGTTSIGTILSFGTGSGGIGTYNMSGAAQLITPAVSMMGSAGAGVGNITIAFDHAAQCAVAEVNQTVH
jgi:uncharacterized phage protein gp47/JayE